jgi:hypothetical protein
LEIHEKEALLPTIQDILKLEVALEEVESIKRASVNLPS